MKDTLNRTVVPLNPGESKELKARVYDLSELAVKQALYGIIHVLSLKVNMSRMMFEEIIDDAAKFSRVVNESHGGKVV